MPEPSPADTLLQISGGYLLTRSLHAMAELGVADKIIGQSTKVASLAAETGTHADALARVLRLLSAHGVFRLTGEVVSHTAASQLLRSDHPQSMRSLVRMMGMPVIWRVEERLIDSLRTGESAASRVLPDGFWAHFSKHPEDARIFDEAMTGKAHGQVAGVVAAYDFSRFTTIADIGGGALWLWRRVHPHRG